MPRRTAPADTPQASDVPRPAPRRRRTSTISLPLVPLRDNVVFPQQMAPLAAGRPMSVASLSTAVADDARIVIAVQRDPALDEVTLEDLHPIAVVATVGALRLLPVGGAHALVEGHQRVRIRSLEADEAGWRATVTPVRDVAALEGAETEALVGAVKQLFTDYANASAMVQPDASVALTRSTDPATVSDVAATAPDLDINDRVALLQENDPDVRLHQLVPLLANLVEVAQLRQRIHEDVQRTITKAQREHIVREQLRILRRELTEIEGAEQEEGGDDLTARVERSQMPDAVRRRVTREISRLEQIPSMSPETGMVRNWIEWLLDLPWGEPAGENIDIARASAILDEDHFGLEQVKERILDWLAVRERARARLEAATAAAADGDAPRRPLQTPILCLVGPPGVGKTSLGRSIARALDRRFVRVSLGGIRDEAEIRGHRRTYIGALPGRIIQSMKQAGVVNPVLMLDEVDKLGADYRGDPSAALLEVLDPEQNREFSDHYLEIGYDLSQVLFITTANLADGISPPLRDRMEVIRITGYTDAEKLGIARRHLIPRQLEQHGLEDGEMVISDDVILAVIRGHTHEAGVRHLDRSLATLARKVPRRLTRRIKHVDITSDALTELLGPAHFEHGRMAEHDEVGAVTGVVVSDVGGDVVSVEAVAIEGRPGLSMTGQIGSVMEESAQAALTWARVHAADYGASGDFFDVNAIHIHVPAGATPKDGPSAGVTLVTALASLASRRPVRRDVAMTGEITLRGRVLPIGGVKDKLLAAHRAGITTFVLPRRNLADLHDVTADVLAGMTIQPVDTVDEVLTLALLGAAPTPVRRTAGFVISPLSVPPTLH